MPEHNTLFEGGVSISRLLSEMRRDFSLAPTVPLIFRPGFLVLK